MKRILIAFTCLFIVKANAQLLSWTPAFATESSTPIVITCDASKGNQGLMAYATTSDVYVHIGVITNKSTSSSDWKHNKFTWATTLAAGNCVSLGSNKWSYTITGGLRTYFGLTDATETIQKIAILFRNGAGTKVQRNADASDMYIPVYDNSTLKVRIDQPFRQPQYNPIPEILTLSVGNNLGITANANSTADLKLYFNGSQVSSALAATTLTGSATITNVGNQQIIAEAVGTTTSRDTFNFVIASPNTIAALPNGVVDGINYEPGDTSVTLVLYAPYKSNAFVIGDFSNWAQSSKYQMNITPDGIRYWLRITGLTPGIEYGYQYLINGNLRIADAYCEKVLDPYNDKYLPVSTYPNLKAYPEGLTSGVVSVLQTAKTAYKWAVPTFTRPDKRNLIIYELLIRDFTAAQTFKNVIDSLPYLQKLGINTIEVMPFNEFEGNNSWGYNPSFYFAPDKNYGTETNVRQFVDACHAQGIAVVMDIALNHSFGQSPMVQLYWDAVNSRPAANNPWYNAIPTHPYNVGYDFNHSAQVTKDFVDRVLTHWLNNYKIDGFRFDLSKGFTQNNTYPSNISGWSAYDASRVAIWKRIYDKMQTVSGGSYCILEHFADNSEETELANYGMLLWGNMNYSYNQATMGYSSGWDLSYGIHAQRGWGQPNLVAYQESHDEERLMYKNEQSGNVSGGYNVKTLATGCKRNAMATAIWSMTPGPKMLLQFGELGYDSTIHTCSNGTINTSGCNTDPKPIKWSYLQDADRKGLYDVYSKLFKLRNHPDYLSTFSTGVIAGNYNLTGTVKQEKLYDANMSVVSFGNFDVNTQTAAIGFPSNGTWYYYVGSTGNYSSINVSGYSYTFTLQAGEYYVFTSVDAKTKVDNQTYAVTGRIITPASKLVQKANVNVTGASATTTQSDATSNYTLNVPQGNYSLRPAKNNDVTKNNGVSSIDIILTQNHILNKIPFTNPYKLIAADVNNDKKVSAIDIIFMKRLILGIDTTFTGSRLWTFVDSSYSFPNAANPFPYKDTISYNWLSINKPNQTFIGIKLGDVDFNWNAAVLKPTIPNNKSIEIYYDDINSSNADLIRIPLKVKNFKSMLGMQYTLNFNQEVFEYVGLEKNKLNFDYNDIQAANGAISFLWADAETEPQTLADGSVLFELVLRKKGTITKEDISIDSKITNVEAYDKDYQLHNIIKGSGSIHSASKISDIKYQESWLVSPNPTTDGIVKLNMSLSQNKNIVFELSNQEGKILLQNKKAITKGYSNFTINLKEQNHLLSGIYFLKAIGMEGETVKRIVVKAN